MVGRPIKASGTVWLCTVFWCSGVREGWGSVIVGFMCLSRVKLFCVAVGSCSQCAFERGAGGCEVFVCCPEAEAVR